MTASFAAMALGCLISSTALAGIADSPLPVLLAGKKTIHVYSVPGLQSTGVLSTFFSCTSTDTATMQVGVETFPFPGGGPSNDPVATSLSVDPGATVIFGTSSAVGISVYSNLSPGFLSQGSARILATSRKLICTAYIADPGNAPPTSGWQLTIVKQKTQKGD
jgi:hypothetical protein